MKELNNKTIEELIEIYKGNYNATTQYAASILLKMILKENYKKVMDEVRESLGYKINTRTRSDVYSWKRRVKKIGKCEICGSKRELVAHHIVPWEYSITGRTDITNGQCLCVKCHHMIHNDELWVKHMRGVYNG